MALMIGCIWHGLDALQGTRAKPGNHLVIYKEIKTINDAQNLQLDLDAACRWEKDWLMHFHPDKCNLISITQKRKPIHFTYKLHDHPLAKVEHSKYLGITLQSNQKMEQTYKFDH